MKVILIGCGQIGIRHLQAIAKLKGNLGIQVIEPSEKAQKNGGVRLQKVLMNLPEKRKIVVEWLNDIEQVEKSADLTIVATTAKGRAEIIGRLLEFGHRRFLIEKMVCQSTREYEHLLRTFNKNQAKGWVDCTRRYYPFYNRTLNLLKRESPIVLNVIAGNLGLGCNAIHFLDLFSALTQNPQDIELSGDYLFPKILPNRRGNDLVEFAGMITAKTNKGSFASITFHPYNEAGAVINIITQNYKVFVDEGNRKAFLTTKQNNWQWENLAFKELYTSDLTTKIARSIIKSDTCKLPTIRDSYYIHKELFRIFNRHIKLITGKDSVFCPIT